MDLIKNLLEIKWEKISSNRSNNTFVINRIDEKSEADIYIGITSDDNKCILVDIRGEEIDYIGFEKLNLKSYINNYYLVLEFTGDSEYFRLFLELCVLIYNTIKSIENKRIAGVTFKEIVLKWSVFFSNKKLLRLSERELIGLWGELFYLNYLLESEFYEPYEIIDSWKGPLNGIRDFQFTNFHIEIKTVLSEDSSLRISSEFQLNPSEHTCIYLTTIVITKNENGFPIEHLINQINQLLENDIELLHKFHQILCHKINFQDIQIYEHYKFSVLNTLNFNASDIDFPSITPQKLPKGVTKVKYQIDIQSINQFLCDIPFE